VSSKLTACWASRAAASLPRSMIGPERNGSAQNIIESGCASSASVSGLGGAYRCGLISMARPLRSGSVLLAREYGNGRRHRSLLRSISPCHPTTIPTGERGILVASAAKIAAMRQLGRHLALLMSRCLKEKDEFIPRRWKCRRKSYPQGPAGRSGP